MNAVEFVTELEGSSMLAIPSDIADRLPKTGKARIIVLTSADNEEEGWQTAAYDQFLRDDSAEDQIYDSLR